MDYYYGSSQSISSRGRFSSRGSSYRGGGRGDSYRGSRGGGYSSRGYSSSRGRGGYYPKYETSGSKYNSSDSGSRYTSHTRVDDGSYRKAESSYGSSREHSHHRSEVDLGRKRIRSDSYSQSQGTTSRRRSHELEDYRGSGSRCTTSNSYTDSRTYSENRGVFKKPRITDFKSKEEYRGRKEIPRSSVPVTKLRSFRGRYIRGRAILRRTGDSFLSRKRPVFSGSKTTSELIALRRTKLLKLRRLRERAKLKAAEDKDEDDEDEGEEDENKKESRNILGSTQEDSNASVGENGDEEEEDGSKKNKQDESYDKDDEKKDKEKIKKEEGEICDGESDTKEKKKSKKVEERVDFFRKPFMKLQCPQCSTKCITFKEYSHHLYSPVHLKAMKEKGIQLKQTLAKMRIAQRLKQKKVDEEDLTNMSLKSTFCRICKLNYSQEKRAHHSSEAHKKLKNFIQPYCRVCRLLMKNPMDYEQHICSLDHMRKKHALDERLGKTKGSSLEYLDNFMVLDSVGSGDEVEESKEEKSEEEAKKDRSDKKSDVSMNVGAEYIRKVEAYYCEVCRTYLPRIPDQERALRIHCIERYHLKCYLRFGTTELLEQIQGKKVLKKGEENRDGKSEDKRNDEIKEENHEEGGEDEDKLWADVSDLLSQVEPEVKSDDEDEEEGGRFDRFKSNEKKENGEVNSSEDCLEEKNDSENTEDKTESKEAT